MVYGLRERESAGSWRIERIEDQVSRDGTRVVIVCRHTFKRMEVTLILSLISDE